MYLANLPYLIDVGSDGRISRTPSSIDTNVSARTRKHLAIAIRRFDEAPADRSSLKPK